MLHVANGHSLTSLIQRAGLPGETTVWADALHEGPVPDLTPDALRAVRAAFLASVAGDVNDRDILLELQQWQASLDGAGAHDEVVLWYEHDLFDQLNLLQVLDILRQRPGARVSLVSVDRFPGHPDFKGMGELTPGEVATLLPARTPVGDAQYETARRGWAAFRSEDPRAIERFLAAGSAPLPFLGAALRRHLEEFPAMGDGLSRTERRLLDIVDARTVPARDVFPRMHEDEQAFYIGDTSFWNMVKGLVSSSPVLVRFDPAGPLSEVAIPPGTLSLTSMGLDVRDGNLDRVELCGIDRWLGGVHLEGHGPLWRWDAAAGCMTWE